MKKYNIIQLMAQEQILISFKRYGIEKTEEIIKSIYKSMPYVKWYMLREYYNVINRSEQYKQMEK